MLLVILLIDMNGYNDVIITGVRRRGRFDILGRADSSVYHLVLDRLLILILRYKHTINN